MADLQRSLNVKPTISSVGSPIAEPADTAGAISKIGDVVKSFVADKKKDKITEELRALGDDVFAVTTGKEVKRATDRITRLKSARDQGAVTQTMVNIEAEAILKEEIDKMPAFAPELRRHAASILGFDPTGSQIRALLDIPDVTNNENSVLKKFRENAEAVALTTGIDPNVAMKLQGKALFAQQNADLITQQAVIGNAGRREIFNATQLEADGQVTDFMGDLVGEINAGGVAEPAAVVAQLQARILGHKQALRDRYAAAGITPDAGDLSKDMTVIDEQWQPLTQMAKEGSLSEILATNAKSISNAMTIEGYNVMGDVALINSVAGQEGVKHYFLTIDKYGKRDQFDLLLANNPALRRSVKTQEQAQVVAAEAYKRVFGMEPAFSDNPITALGTSSRGAQGSVDPEALGAMTDQLFYDSLKNPRSNREALVTFAKQHGQKFKILGGYFQQGVRSSSSPEEIRFVTQTFEEEYPQMVNRLAGEITADGNWVVEVVGGQLRVNTPSLGQLPGGGPGSRFAPVSGLPDVRLSPTVEADLKRLNSFNKGLKNGWATDLKKNPESFLQETAATINGEVEKVNSSQENLNAAITAFEQNPSPENLEAIRSIDPELVAEVERMSTTGSQSGGDNNAQQ